MKIADVPGLPARAKKALPKRLESLDGLTLAEVERTPGVGAAAIQALLEAGWEPKSDHESAAEEAEEVFAPHDPGHADLVLLAEHFVDLMTDHAALTPGLVCQAWDAALAFIQESRRAEGVDLEIHVGLSVRHLGGNFRIDRIQDVAGEGIPQGSRRVLLVPA